MATRHDVFPPDMCRELEHLHSQAPSHRFGHTRAAIERSFGRPIDALFQSFDREPIASGSIGQVHLARLSEEGARGTGCTPGTTVAVKVKHPGVDLAIDMDFRIMRWVAQIAEVRSDRGRRPARDREPEPEGDKWGEKEHPRWLLVVQMIPSLRALKLGQILEQFSAPLHEQVRPPGTPPTAASPAGRAPALAPRVWSTGATIRAARPHPHAGEL